MTDAARARCHASAAYAAVLRVRSARATNNVNLCSR